MPPVLDQVIQLFRENITEATDIVAEKLPGDASNRSYYRVRGGGQSVIAMVLAPADPHKGAEEIAKDSGVVTELPFVNVLRFLSRAGLPVPKLLYDGQHESVLLLEDLGDVTLLEHALPLGPAERERIYGVAVDQLVRLQRAAYDAVADTSFIGFRRRFDRDLLYWEFHHFLEYGVEKKGIQVAPDDRAALDAAFRQLSDRIASLPEVIVHRDYHSRNLMLHGDRLAIIDFQDALLGPVPYDLASLLRDSYIALGEPLVDRLVEHYWERARAAGLPVGASRDEFRAWFDVVSVQRNLKAAGRFDYIHQVKGNPKFLADIPRTLGYVKTNLAKHPELAPLRRLARYVPALA